MVELTIGIAAVAGLGSFLAPCILPMIPAFLAYISGTTLTEIQRNNGTVNVVASRINITLNTLFFVAGFTIVFSFLGVILNSILAASAASLLAGFNHVGGIIIIAFGVFMLLSTKISRLNFEKKIFPANCGLCKKRKYCSGVDKKYVEVYGDKEFIPFYSFFN